MDDSCTKTGTAAAIVHMDPREGRASKVRICYQNEEVAEKK